MKKEDLLKINRCNGPLNQKIMVYMGFGMQRWIYKQQPRKFFSKDRSPAGDSFDVGIEGGNKLAGRASNAKDARERVNQYFRAGRRARRIGLALSLLAGALLVWFAYVLSQNNYERNNFEQMRARQETAAMARRAAAVQEAYQLFLHSGNQHLDAGEYAVAIDDFSRAARFFPEERAAYVGIARAYQGLCEVQGKQCDKAEEWAHVR